jgi:hypothetical protein
MSGLRPRLIVFSLAAAVAYTLAYYFDWSLFQYYLTDNRVLFFGQGVGEGPPILWYGWIGTALAGGLAAALLVPPKLAAKLPADLVWLLPLMLIFAALMYEKRWFM